jgi:trehalose 6-phosphate synthase/phosphatase
MSLLIISNRLPFTINHSGNEISLIPSTGGLVSGISSYLDYMKHSPVSDFEYLWVGWPGAYMDEPLQKSFSSQVRENQNVIPVFISEEEMDKFYLGFCNSTIWPLFHYFPTYAKYEEEHWEIYKKVNKYFCDKICEVVNEGDIIWIHDYHLMLLPDMLRKRLGNKFKIGFFLHIVFPSFEIYRIMPSTWRKEILEGILGADLIGFHTNEFTYSFLRSVLRILGLSNSLGKIIYQDRIVKADTFPMGIDFEKFNNAIDNKDVEKEREELKFKLKDRKMILSVDRLDYTKGVINRLKSFSKFLLDNPGYSKKIVFILIIVPSRIGIDQYQEIKDNLDKLISNINSEFGDLDWQPIIYQYKYIPFENLVALYNLADVALITPLRDGMNLVAKEYVACQKDSPGVLILSEMAGASKEMPEALLINPNDIKQTADGIKEALEMKREDAFSRIQKIQDRIRYYDVLEWAKDFLSQMDKVKNENKRIEVKMLSQDDKAKIKLSFQNAQKKLILLDYDGTLVPFNKFPQEAKPDKELLDILKEISKNAELAILSGRDSSFLTEHFDFLNINLCSEHGAFIKEKNQNWYSLTQVEISWKKEMKYIFETFSRRLPGSFIEEKNFSIALHYRNCDPELAEIRVKEFFDEMVNYTSNLNLQILQGNKVVEIRNYNINKANAGMYFINKEKYEFILFIGDDWTDEDLFDFLKDKNAYTIKVGYGISKAKFNVYNYKDVRNLLMELL